VIKTETIERINESDEGSMQNIGMLSSNTYHTLDVETTLQYSQKTKNDLNIVNKKKVRKSKIFKH